MIPASQQGLQDQIIIVFGITQEEIGDLAHHLLIQITGNPEIHQGHPAVGHDDGIARVRIGVKITELHQLAGKGAQTDVGYSLGDPGPGP